MIRTDNYGQAYVPILAACCLWGGRHILAQPILFWTLRALDSVFTIIASQFMIRVRQATQRPPTSTASLLLLHHWLANRLAAGGAATSTAVTRPEVTSTTSSIPSFNDFYTVTVPGRPAAPAVGNFEASQSGDPRAHTLAPFAVPGFPNDGVRQGRTTRTASEQACTRTRRR